MSDPGDGGRSLKVRCGLKPESAAGTCDFVRRLHTPAPLSRVCSHTRCQVDIDGTQHRHDGQVEEGEACQLHLRGGANEGRGHRQQHSHSAIKAASVPLQHLPD